MTVKEKNTNNSLRISFRSHRKGLTLLEVVIASSILVVIMTAMLPQIRNIHNGWDSKQAVATMTQNGRVFIDHLNRMISQAEYISAISDPDETEGYIEFEASDGNTYRYEYDSGYIKYGEPGSVESLAGPVSGLTFSCYKPYDLDTALSDPTGAEFVKVSATFTDSETGLSRTYDSSVYLRVRVPLIVGNFLEDANADFEDYHMEGVDEVCDYWWGNNDYWTDEEAYEGNACLKGELNRDPSGDDYASNTKINNEEEKYQLEPGRTYYYSAWVKLSSAGSGYAFIAISAPGLPWPDNFIVSDFVYSGEWTKVEVQWTTPTGEDWEDINYIAVQLRWNMSPGEWAYFDDVYFTEL
jgi:prepilin-type N-terminal cleavage/methylation domain-containing protein